jgi:DNA modification methylase
MRNVAYNPIYKSRPFTDFASVNPSTLLSSLSLNWREQDLPEKERTKHVHRLHPYLGKFVPQLAEIFLRKFKPDTVCDPFCGSGTTLVEALSLGINSVGCDISAFNCLLTKVKTDEYDLSLLEREIRDIIQKTEAMLNPSLFSKGAFEGKADNQYLRIWFSPNALRQLSCYRSLTSRYKYRDVLKIILSRSARSARLTTHFDLDFPKEPQAEPYYCYKHDRTCQPADDALQFLKRYSLDTLKRIKEFSRIRSDAKVEIICGDARKVRFPKMDAVITSPPYVGLIDYHEQHRYAYELLGLPKNEEMEIGPAANGNSKKATEQYMDSIGQVFSNIRKSLKKGGVVVIVVNDKKNLYKNLGPKIGYAPEEVLTRHVNRRTGRRSTDFYEEILIWRKHD